MGHLVILVVFFFFFSLMFCFKPAFSLFSFTVIKRLFCSSSFSVIRVVSSTHLRILIFLLTILIPSCDSSSPFHMMCVCVCSQSYLTLLQSWTVACQDPLLEFFSKNLGSGCHFLLQSIVSTQGLNLHPLCLLHYQVNSLPLCHLGNPLCIEVK